MNRVADLDNLVQHGALKGSIFKAKTLSAKRLRGLGMLTAAGFAYAHFGAMALLLGKTLPTVGIAITTAMGARAFADSDVITQIDYVREGEH